MCNTHDNVIRWKHFPRCWPFVRANHRSPVNSPHKGKWRGALMFSLICSWIKGWVNIGEAGDLRRNRAHYDVTVMSILDVCTMTNLIAFVVLPFVLSFSSKTLTDCSVTVFNNNNNIIIMLHLYSANLKNGEKSPCSKALVSRKH